MKDNLEITNDTKDKTLENICLDENEVNDENDRWNRLSAENPQLLYEIMNGTPHK